MRKKLAENLHAVRSRIAEAAARAERDPDEITLLAVTKSVDLEVIRTLLDLGVTEFGENRTQQLAQRAGMIGEYLSRKSMLDQDTAPQTSPDRTCSSSSPMERTQATRI